ncbi:hypothetical protein HOLleu_00147 [Holothuria leucospilota]|uniref:Uncharacterized protein n=1 Tax=Holothuria leucospilota TaxID=206669 RepID=A0A9Q1CLW1_HOLLE|nr:hypothetical protein HOLleu_00147 [Holothuria leucospilota]
MKVLTRDRINSILWVPPYNRFVVSTYLYSRFCTIACTRTQENGFVLVLTDFGSYALGLIQNFTLVLMRKMCTCIHTHNQIHSTCACTHNSVLTLQVCLTNPSFSYLTNVYCNSSFHLK